MRTVWTSKTPKARLTPGCGEDSWPIQGGFRGCSGGQVNTLETELTLNSMARGQKATFRDGSALRILLTAIITGGCAPEYRLDKGRRTPLNRSTRWAWRP